MIVVKNEIVAASSPSHSFLVGVAGGWINKEYVCIMLLGFKVGSDSAHGCRRVPLFLSCWQIVSRISKRNFQQTIANWIPQCPCRFFPVEGVEYGGWYLLVGCSRRKVGWSNHNDIWQRLGNSEDGSVAVKRCYLTDLLEVNNKGSTCGR